MSGTAPAAPPQPPEQIEWSITGQNEHRKTLSATVTVTDPRTGRARTRRKEIIQLGTGLNYRGEDGQWHPTREEFELTPEGFAVARFGPHQLIVENNINSATAIDFMTSDGVRLRSGPLAVAYYDPVTGQNLILATIRDTAGELTAPNEVTFKSAFDTLDASIRITYRRSGMSSDLILHEMPPDPELLGLSADSRIELYTEFLPDTPAPGQQARVLRRESDPVRRRLMAEPDFTDHQVDFGAYKMGLGVAFEITGANDGERVPVAKRYDNLGGRKILTEAIEWRSAKGLLAALPPGRKTFGPVAPMQANAVRNLPVRRLAAGNPKPIQQARLDLRSSRGHETQTAQSAIRNSKSPVDQSLLTSAPTERKAGFVLDYSLVTGTTNFTFEGGKTYYVASDVYLYGAITFENAIIKYTNAPASASVRVRGPVEFKTGDYTPLICTSEDDDSIGETLPWSSGNPWTNHAGNPMIEFDANYAGQVASAHHLRVSHAATAISFNYGTGHVVKHAQFVHCSYVLSPYYADVRARNILAYQAERVVTGPGGSTARFEHLTAHQANYLNPGSYYGPTVYLTNSLLVAVTNTGAYSGANNASNSSSAVFLPTGAGAHYLADATYRGIGNTAANPALAAELRARTTQPPSVQTNGWILANVTLNPRADIRYTSPTAAPDLGYHYPLLDYVLGAIWVTNATVTLNPGVAVGCAVPFANYYTMLLMDGAKLIADGLPTNLVRMARHNLVQEQANDTWKFHGAGIYTPWWTTVAQPELRLRFTQVSMPGEWILGSYYDPTPLSFADCQFHGGLMVPPATAIIGVTNCLWDGVDWFIDAYYGPTVTMRNNLFRRGLLEIWDPTPLVTLRDNVFDRSTNIIYGDITNSHNAYVGGATRLLPPNASDQVLSSLAYDTGPLSRYYLPAGNALINAGSQSAAASGLFHYTTTTNQAPESGTTVDIGLHWLALNGQNQPADTDADYVWDYLEDANGNGTQEVGEFSHTVADTDNDGDGLSNAQEFTLTLSPVKQDTDGNNIPDWHEDPDGDLLGNGAELYTYNTDPLNRFTLSPTGKHTDAEWYLGGWFEPAGPLPTPPNELGVPMVVGNDITMAFNPVSGPLWDLYFTETLPVNRAPYVWWRYQDQGPNPTTTSFTQINPNRPFMFFAAGLASDSDTTAGPTPMPASDGLTDGYEMLVSRTSITSPDTDGDRYSDGPLTPGTTAPNGMTWRGANDAFPNDSTIAIDTDRDGIPDELVSGALCPSCDTDDDNDGIPDQNEISAGSNPRNAESIPLPRWFVNVNTLYPNDADGSSQLPYPTIQAVLSNPALADYDVIQVESGRYLAARL